MVPPAPQRGLTPAFADARRDDARVEVRDAAHREGADDADRLRRILRYHGRLRRGRRRRQHANRGAERRKAT
jgi:hypothetical protein